MWMVASSQSTSRPFIQIFFVGVMGTAASLVRLLPSIAPHRERGCGPDGGALSGHAPSGPGRLGALAGEGRQPVADLLRAAGLGGVAGGQVEGDRGLHPPGL